jgi:hypothetical protein
LITGRQKIWTATGYFGLHDVMTEAINGYLTSHGKPPMA